MLVEVVDVEISPIMVLFSYSWIPHRYSHDVSFQIVVVVVINTSSIAEKGKGGEKCSGIHRKGGCYYHRPRRRWCQLVKVTTATDSNLHKWTTKGEKEEAKWTEEKRVTDLMMALFGMAWLLKMRSDIRSPGTRVIYSAFSLSFFLPRPWPLYFTPQALRNNNAITFHTHTKGRESKCPSAVTKMFSGAHISYPFLRIIKTRIKVQDDKSRKPEKNLPEGVAYFCLSG